MGGFCDIVAVAVVGGDTVALVVLCVVAVVRYWLQKPCSLS